MNLRKPVIIFLHAVVGWALHAATMGIGLVGVRRHWASPAKGMLGWITYVTRCESIATYSIAQVQHIQLLWTLLVCSVTPLCTPRQERTG
jgi:hypothetical protein